MSKLLVILGATGQQGGSIISYVLNDSVLAKEYKLRGVSRDPSTSLAQDLIQKGVEIVKADVDAPESLKNAFKDAHTVFGQTNTIYDYNAKEREFNQGKAIADEAVAAGVQCLIWSTGTNVTKITDGELKCVTQFDVKAEIEDYIRSLPIRSAFYAPGSFMQNFHTQMKPHPSGDGTYVISNILKPETKIPFIDIVGDTGKFIAPILEEPDKYEGKVFCAAVKLYSVEEVTQTLSAVTGKIVNYKQVPEEIFHGFLPPTFADELIQMFKYIRDYGYYGPLTEEAVEWTSKQVHGKLTTIEEYLSIDPLNLS